MCNQVMVKVLFSTVRKKHTTKTTGYSSGNDIVTVEISKVLSLLFSNTVKQLAVILVI